MNSCSVNYYFAPFINNTSAEFQSIELWFTDPEKRPHEIEDSVNITLTIVKTL